METLARRNRSLARSEAWAGHELAHDIRRILLSEPQILVAFRDYAMSQKRMREATAPIRGVKIEVGPHGPVLRALTGPGESTTPVLLAGDDLVRACVMFCLREGIALPTRGIKTVEVLAERLALVIRRIHAGDPEAQDWVTAFENDAVPHPVENDHPLDSGRVAELQDARVILFSMREVHEAIADHLVHVSRHSELGRFEEVVIEQEAEGLFARVTFPPDCGGGTRVLRPSELLDAAVLFCKKQRITLPAHTSKWLAAVSGDRLSLVIPQKNDNTIAAGAELVAR